LRRESRFVRDVDLPTFRGRSYESVDSQERSEGHERFTTNFLDGV